MNMFYIARQQLTLIIRSKWLISFGMLFVFLAFFVAYFSNAGNSGFDGFNRMTASLLNLNLIIIPLISLLMGSLFIAGEKEDGGLMLLLTYPVSNFSVIMGKYAGLLTAVAAVLTCGYGASLLAMGILHTGGPVKGILQFYGLSFLLAAIFLSLSILIGIRAKSRFQALGISLFIWALSVLFYEFIIMGISLFLSNRLILSLLTVSVFLNPVEIIRVWSIFSLGGAAVFGPSLYDFTVWADGWIGTFLFAVSSLVWVAVPLQLAQIVVKKGMEND